MRRTGWYGVCPPHAVPGYCLSYLVLLAVRVPRHCLCGPTLVVYVLLLCYHVTDRADVYGPAGRWPVAPWARARTLRADADPDRSTSIHPSIRSARAVYRPLRALSLCTLMLRALSALSLCALSLCALTLCITLCLSLTPNSLMLSSLTLRVLVLLSDTHSRADVFEILLGVRAPG